MLRRLRRAARRRIALMALANTMVLPVEQFGSPWSAGRDIGKEGRCEARRRRGRGGGGQCDLQDRGRHCYVPGCAARR